MTKYKIIYNELTDCYEILSFVNRSSKKIHAECIKILSSDEMSDLIELLKVGNL